MRVLTILVAVGIIAGALGQIPDCVQATADLEACNKQAYDDYRTAFTAGDDRKKPAWLARKSCNYLTATVEECGKKMIGCLTEDQLNQKRDEQLVTALEQVKKQVKEWDSSLCPVTQKHEERLQAAADKTAAEEEAAANKTPESDPTGSSTTMTASVLSTFILAIFL